MSQAYSLHVLKVAVARICQTIGWHSAHTTPIDLLIDVTQHFLREMCRIMMRYCELYNRTEPNLDDLALAYRDMGINLQELMEYIQFVDPIMLPFEVPRFPVPRESNLNFLKPGSREMMMRPLHIPWYMPPMFPELEEAPSAVEGGELANEEDKALVRLDLPPRARAILDVMGASSADSVEPEATELNLLEGATLSEITIEDTSERVAEPGAVVEESALLPETTVVNEEVEIPMQTVEVKEPTEDAPPAPSAPTDATLLPPVPVARDVAKRPEAPLDKGGETSKPNNQQPTTSEGRPTRNISSVIMTTSGFISPAREGKLPDSRIPIIPEERPPKMLQPPPPPPAMSAPHPVSGSAAQGVAASLAASSSGPTLTHPHSRDNKHGGTSAAGGPLAGGTPFAAGSPAAASSTASLKAGGGGGGEKSGKKVKKKPVDRERKKGDKKGSNATPKGEKSSTGSEPSSVVGGAQAVDGSVGWGAMSAVLQPPQQQQLEAATGVGSQPPTVATGGPTSFLQPVTPADAGFGVFPAPPEPPTASGVKASSGKAGKEKAVKKRKAPQVHDIALLSAPELFDKLPPPAKQPKVKGSAKRIKQNKKLQAEGQALFAPHVVPSVATVPPYQTGPDGAQPAPPLIGPWRPGGGSLLGDKFSLPNATPLVPPPELVGKAPPPFGHQTPKQKAASGKQHQGKSEVAASEQAAQLSLLQMMHPSLEITASPSVPERTPPKAAGSSKKAGTKAKDAKLQPPPPEVRDDRDVIVIDDDRSPPRTPSLLLPSPSESKKQRKQQTPIARQPDSLFGAAGHSEYDFSMSSPGANPGPSLSFRDFSSPEGHAGSGGIPKTPDIKLPMSAGSPLLDVDGRKAGRSVPMADAFASDASMAKMPGVGAPPPPAAKPKRQKQKTPKADQPGGKQGKQQQQPVDQQQPEPPQFGAGSEQNRNMFPLFPPGPQGLGQYNNYLNQSLQAGMRLGLFPFPSGPGLIPDNPLFPLQPGPYPMGAANFPLPPNPFALPRMGSLMRMPHPLAGGRRGMGMGGGGGAGGGGSLHPHHHHHGAFDDNLDPETKLAQTPLDLQKSNCNVAPLVPPSLLQDESLNLSLRLGGSSLLGTATATSSSATQPAKQQQEPQPPAPSPATAGMGFLSAQPASTQASKQPSKQQESSRKEDQVVILPAASVLPGASPPQRSSMCVIDLDGDSDGSQSTTKDDNGRRKVGKEHKKERKVKDGKIKKKKDKKDKSKSKEREREQQLKELTAGTASSSAVLTMGMIGAEEALMEQLRKERKEKKEKRKDKVKKEKRKERERAQLVAGGDTLMVATPPTGADSQPGPAVPKLIMKLSGSGATPSPRSDTPDHHHPTVVASTADQPKRDGSPELARISALVTRPPKLKPTGALGGGGSKGSKGKDESLLDDDASGFEDVAFPSAGAPAGAKHHSLTAGSVADPTTGGNNRSVSTGIMPTIGAGSSSTSAAASSTAKGSSKATRVGAEYGGGKSGVAKLPPTSIATGSTGSSSSSRKTPKDGSSSKGSKAAAVASSTSAGATAHHHHHHASSSSTLAAVSAPAQMTDVDGNTVWICPACGRVDDGTPMIGCDGCDAWYHWVCVGISVPPDDNEDWYCRVCIGKMQDSHADTEKQRKRKKKDKKTPKD